MKGVRLEIQREMDNRYTSTTRQIHMLWIYTDIMVRK